VLMIAPTLSGWIVCRLQFARHTSDDSRSA
jgi:hypothetical protein